SQSLRHTAVGNPGTVEPDPSLKITDLEDLNSKVAELAGQLQKMKSEIIRPSKDSSTFSTAQRMVETFLGQISAVKVEVTTTVARGHRFDPAYLRLEIMNLEKQSYEWLCERA